MPLQANGRFFFFPGVELNCSHLWVPGAFLGCKDVFKDDQKNRLLLVAGNFSLCFRLGGHKEVLFWGQTPATGGVAVALPRGFVLLVFAIHSVREHGGFRWNEGPHDLLVTVMTKCQAQ